PNTGGMGAYSPTRVLTPSLEEKVMETIVRPTIEGMAREGRPYQGVLYVGLMLNADGPRVVEFNCRFGDPETQVILPRLKSDLYPVLEGCAKGDLGDLELQWDPRSALCVVLASQGYPGDYKVGEPITIGSLDDDIYLFHAGTAYQGGQLVTDGGRVLGVTALGDDLAQAQERAYAACREISFPGCYYRRDIGWRAL
ncbi:MAG: phosphoribosylamine--glycine ligase, partial [Limnochordia bacterium]